MEAIGEECVAISDGDFLWGEKKPKNQIKELSIVLKNIV